MNTTMFLYIWVCGVAAIIIDRQCLVSAECTGAACRRMRVCQCDRSTIPQRCIKICVRLTAPGKRSNELSFLDESDNQYISPSDRQSSKFLNAFLSYQLHHVEHPQCVLDSFFMLYPPIVQAKIIEVFKEAEKTLQDIKDILDLEINFKATRSMITSASPLLNDIEDDGNVHNVPSIYRGNPVSICTQLLICSDYNARQRMTLEDKKSNINLVKKQACAGLINSIARMTFK